MKTRTRPTRWTKKIVKQSRVGSHCESRLFTPLSRIPLSLYSRPGSPDPWTDVAQKESEKALAQDREARPFTIDEQNGIVIFIKWNDAFDSSNLDDEGNWID